MAPLAQNLNTFSRREMLTISAGAGAAILCASNPSFAHQVAPISTPTGLYAKLPANDTKLEKWFVQSASDIAARPDIAICGEHDGRMSQGCNVVIGYMFLTPTKPNDEGALDYLVITAGHQTATTALNVQSFTRNCAGKNVAIICPDSLAGMAHMTDVSRQIESLGGHVVEARLDRSAASLATYPADVDVVYHVIPRSSVL